MEQFKIPVKEVVLTAPNYQLVCDQIEHAHTIEKKIKDFLEKLYALGFKFEGDILNADELTVRQNPTESGFIITGRKSKK
tara:strand:+ start:16935 stop:17174 length:240 start_codon:yes stop_codon:yes gene_type:complete